MSAQTAWKLWGILLLKLFYIQNWGMMEIWFVLMFHDHHCKICSWFGICTTWYKPNTFDGQRLFQQNVNSIDFQLWVKFVAKQFPAPFLPLTFPVQATEYSARIKQHDSSLYPQIIRCHIYWQQDRWTQESTVRVNFNNLHCCSTWECSKMQMHTDVFSKAKELHSILHIPLTHLPLVLHICVSELGQHWCK